LEQLEDSATENVETLLKQILESRKEHQKLGNSTIDSIQKLFSAVQNGTSTLEEATSQAFQSILSKQKSLEESLEKGTVGHKEAIEQLLSLAESVRDLQAEVLESQAEQVQRSRVIGDTTEKMDTFLNQLVHGAELAIYLAQLSGRVLKIILIYLVLFQLSKVFSWFFGFSLLNSLTKLLCACALLSEVTFPELAWETRIITSSSAALFFLFFLLAHWLSPTRQPKGSKGSSWDPEVSPSTEGGSSLPMMIDYIVQLRLAGGEAPVPTELEKLLTLPPPSYTLGVDEEGEETLVSLD